MGMVHCSELRNSEVKSSLHGFMVEHEISDGLQKDLLRRISQQDHSAVAEFYDQVAGMLFSTAVRILRDTHDAEEIIQDVFIQIWNKAGAFDPSMGTPLHWSLAITRHRCIDRLRSRKRRSRLADEMTQQSDMTSAVSSRPPVQLLSTAETSAVQQAVKGLPNEQRIAIEMAFFNGLSHAEIAESLNEPLGTVKARIRRGMLKLREQLKNYL
jgi:RNA polymerase sigma-70 factor, ECF subfamily